MFFVSPLVEYFLCYKVFATFEGASIVRQWGDEALGSF